MAPPAATPTRGRRVKRSSGDEREAAIRVTLEELLAERRFHEISIDDLAKGAGISRPTFYFYFPSKEAVLLSLLDEMVSLADAGSDAAQAQIDKDPARYLRDALAAYVTVFGLHRNVAVAGNEASVTSPEIRDLWEPVRERWVAAAESAIEAERKRGAAPAGLPARELAIALLNMNEGVMQTTFAGQQPALPEERIVEVITHIWISAVYGGQPPAAT